MLVKIVQHNFSGVEIRRVRLVIMALKDYTNLYVIIFYHLITYIIIRRKEVRK